MKKISLFLRILTFILLIISIKSEISGQEKPFDPVKIKQIKQYKSIQLENGLTLLHLHTKDTNTCFIRAYTNLPEYVSKNFRPVLEIENEIRKSGKTNLPINWSAESLKKLEISLSKDANGYFATCNSKWLDTTLFLFSDVFQMLPANQSEMDKAKKAILARADSINRLPDDKIDKITKSIIYGKEHPILKPYSPAEINGVSLEQFTDFREKFYKPNNSFLFVMSNISIDSVKVLANRSLGLWKKRVVPSADYKLIPIEEPKIVFFDTIPSGQTDIKILFPFALYPYTFDSEKAELLSLVFQDVLSEKLVSSQKLAKQIKARFESDKITGNYQLQVQLEKDSLNLVIQSIVETISEFKAGKFDQEKVMRAKQKIIDDFKRLGADNERISWLIIHSERSNLAKNYYADFIEEIGNTSLQGMQTFAAKYLNYNTALFQIPGKWYHSLNDFIKLSKDFRIELYKLDGTLHKVIPKGFNGFSVVANYVAAVGGEQTIKRLKEVSVSYGAIYEVKDGEQLFVEGLMIHKDDDKYFSESHLIRPKKDTLLLQIEIFNGALGIDSSMQGRKKLIGTPLELLKYKVPFVPETKYREWQYQARLTMADTLNGNHVWVVVIENPAKQYIIDYYDVDKGIRYKRQIKDTDYFKDRTIHYSRYQRDSEDEILYPHLKIIETDETTIRMRIREINYDSKSDKKRFEIF